MAITLFFGLAVATSLVLILIPCAYGLLADLQTLVRTPIVFLRRLLSGAELHPEEGST
jgi:hypothetical protein